MILASFMLREPIDLINIGLEDKFYNRWSFGAAFWGAKEIYLYYCRDRQITNSQAYPVSCHGGPETSLNL